MHNILPPQEFGFRKEHNTSQPLIKIKTLVKDNFQNAKSTGMILLDKNQNLIRFGTMVSFTS